MPDERLFDVPEPEANGDANAAIEYAALGTAAELLLTARLMLLGHRVALPVVDDGVDLIVNYRQCVQVRSGAFRKPSGALQINVTKRRAHGRSRRDLEPDVDVLAIYARDTDTWWHLPSDVVGARPIVYVAEAGPLAEWRDAWHVYDPAGGPLPAQTVTSGTGALSGREA